MINEYLRRYTSFALERSEALTPYNNELTRAREMFGLEDWQIMSDFAERELLGEMRKEKNVAIMQVERSPDLKEKTIVVHFDKDFFDQNPEKLSPVCDHELAHLIICPWKESGLFQTGRGMEETQVIHISLACEMLRQNPENFKIKDKNDLTEIVDKAKTLTRLDVNDWRIETKEGKVCQGGEDLPAFAYSSFYENHSHFGLLSAREVTLEVDREFVREKDLHLPDVVLKELWRIVLNPYGKPNRTNIQEQQLGRIMKACKQLGWGK